MPRRKKTQRRRIKDDEDEEEGVKEMMGQNLAEESSNVENKRDLAASKLQEDDDVLGQKSAAEIAREIEELQEKLGEYSPKS